MIAQVKSNHICGKKPRRRESWLFQRYQELRWVYEQTRENKSDSVEWKVGLELRRGRRDTKQDKVKTWVAIVGE